MRIPHCTQELIHVHGYGFKGHTLDTHAQGWNLDLDGNKAIITQYSSTVHIGMAQHGVASTIVHLR